MNERRYVKKWSADLVKRYPAVDLLVDSRRVAASPASLTVPVCEAVL